MTTDPTDTDAEALAKARAFLTAEKAKADAAEAERPKAVCSVCGGIVRAGRDLVIGEPTLADRNIDAERAYNGLPPLYGWQRKHQACIDSAAVVRAITGRKVSDAVATLALAAANPPVPGGDPFGHAPLYADLRSSPFESWTGKAWAHLTADDRKRLSDIIDEEAREYRLRNEDHACLDGACGFCGVRLARKWYAVPLKWSDGTDAPACAKCAAVVRRRPSTTDKRALRTIGIEALSGASGAGLDEYLGDEMQIFVDVAGNDHSGTDEPWSFAPEALDEIREAARIALPGSLPEPLRTEYRAKVAAAREANRQRDVEQREAERRAELTEAGWVS